MDDITKQINKPKVDEKNVDETLQGNKHNFDTIDTSVYDETLKDIEYILDNLEQKKNTEKDQLEKKTHNSNKTISLFNELNDQSINGDKEHIIDKNLLSIEESEILKKNDKKNNKNFFGFYSYLILITVIFFALYETLNISKSLIITEYPITEPYIQYFFEIVEMISIIVFSIINSIKALI